MRRTKVLQRLARACGAAGASQPALPPAWRPELTAVEFRAAPIWLTLPAIRLAASTGVAAFSCSAIRQQQATKVADQVADAAASSSGRQDSSDDEFLRSATATEGPLALYKSGRESGLYRKDPRQEATVGVLQQLYEELRKVLKRRRGLTLMDHVDAPPKSNWWGLEALVHAVADGGGEEEAPRLQGVYMFGGVGVGKTMLMDLLVKAAPPEFQLHRTHFHDFMLDVHARLRRQSAAADPLVRVADEIAHSMRVLALDEFFVTDVADAMILARLFGRLWERGLVLVATSNRAPDALYEGGLQRSLFLPFIARLKKECKVHDMESSTDYRRLAVHQQGLYFVGPDAQAALDARFAEVTAGQAAHPERIQVMMGRHLDIPRAADAACYFTFDELCGKPVAAADYIALTARYHTLALSGVPVFSGATRSQAYRFQTLVDVLYEHRTRLLVAAEGLPFDLFANVLTQTEARLRRDTQEDDSTVVVDDNLGFAKERTISRLTEMGSIEYLLAHARAHAPELVLALQEAAAARAAPQPRRFN